MDPDFIREEVSDEQIDQLVQEIGKEVFIKRQVEGRVQRPRNMGPIKNHEVMLRRKTIAQLKTIQRERSLEQGVTNREYKKLEKAKEYNRTLPYKPIVNWPGKPQWKHKRDIANAKKFAMDPKTRNKQKGYMRIGELLEIQEDMQRKQLSIDEQDDRLDRETEERIGMPLVDLEGANDADDVDQWDILREVPRLRDEYGPNYSELLQNYRESANAIDLLNRQDQQRRVTSPDDSGPPVTDLSSLRGDLFVQPSDESDQEEQSDQPINLEELFNQSMAAFEGAQGKDQGQQPPKPQPVPKKDPGARAQLTQPKSKKPSKGKKADLKGQGKQASSPPSGQQGQPEQSQQDEQES